MPGKARRKLVAVALEGSVERFRMRRRSRNRSLLWDVVDDINWAIFEGLSQEGSLQLMEDSWLIVDSLTAGGVCDVREILRCAESIARSEVGE